MEDLCRRARPDCTDICCRRVWVWVEFRDLLFFHIAGHPGPPNTNLQAGKAITAAIPAHRLPSTVFIGNRSTRRYGDFLLTLRGYGEKYRL